MFLRKVEKWEEKGVIFIEEVHERRSDTSIWDNSQYKSDTRRES